MYKCNIFYSCIYKCVVKKYLKFFSTHFLVNFIMQNIRHKNDALYKKSSFGIADAWLCCLQRRGGISY